MQARGLIVGLLAATTFGLCAVASAQTQTPQIQQRQTPTVRPAGPGVITALAPDLVPIPSRIEHGAVSVRNAGTAPSVATYVTVNCHLPGQEGGCPEIPAQYVGAYTDPDFPNRLTVPLPAIQPGHVHTHYLSFWNATPFPAGTYVFEFVADAAPLNNESNEANNAASHNWVKP